MVLTRMKLYIILFGINIMPLVFGDEEGINVDSVCNSTISERVDYEFNSDVVSSEHIISYKGYFPRSTRENYVNAALRNAGVSLTIKIIHNKFN